MEALDWTLWQLADSAFPSGGFAHSGGLEAAIQAGVVHDSASLVVALRASVWQTAAAALPAVSAVVEDSTRFDEVERRLDAALNNHVARRASVAQGQALLSAGPRVFRNHDVREWASACRANQTPGHLAPVFGYLAQALGMSVAQAAELFLFLNLRSVSSAAVRLGVIGPLKAQELLQDLIPGARDAAARSAEMTLDDLYQSAPLLDVLQSGQDRLYSRLFQS